MKKGFCLSAVQKAWIFLVLAIVAEVLGSSSLKMFENQLIVKYLFMGSCISVSYFFMGMAVKKIPIGLAYAMWEALGMSLISLIGVFIFDEVLSFYQKIGIVLSITGVILVNFGEGEK